MRTKHLVLIAVGCLTIGCESRNAPEQSAKPEATVRTDPPAAQPFYGWYRTNSDEAAYVLITKLTIPGLFNEHTEEIRIARHSVTEEEDGTLEFLTEGYRAMAYGHGRNEKGGFGSGGGINLVEGFEHDDKVVLDVNYYWKTPDQMSGRLNEKVPVKIGVPIDVQLPGDCRLQVTWDNAQQP